MAPLIDGEAERLRARLDAPTPSPSIHGSYAFAQGTPAGAAQHVDAGETYRGAPSSYAPPSPHTGAPAVAACWTSAAAAGSGPPPLSGLLKSLQVLSDAGAGTTPFGAAAIADATAEARRGYVALCSLALRALCLSARDLVLQRACSCPARSLAAGCFR